MDGFLNPPEVLNKLELRDDMIVADFGSGSGGWAIPLAKKLKMGKVYAVDVQEQALQALKTKAEMAKITNIKLVRADLEQSLGSSIQAGLLDLVLMSNLLFQVKNKKGVMAEAKRVLRTKGKLLVVDWKPDALLGPEGERVSPERIKEMVQEMGFALDKEVSAGAYHWGLLFTEI